MGSIPKEIEDIINNDPTGELLVKEAKRIGKELHTTHAMQTSQLRNIFTEFRKIQTQLIFEQQHPDSADKKARLRFVMLRPKLAYQVVRNKPLTGLQKVLDPAIDCVNQASTKDEFERRFERFANFFEAILAYHREAIGR